MPVFIYPSNVYSVDYNSSKKMAYVVGQCASASSSSGVAQYNFMIEALSNQAPYTRSWFKDMSTYGWTTSPILNSTYDETNDILYLVYNGSAGHTYLHAISGVDGSDVYTRVTLNASLTIGTWGAFSLSNDVYMAINGATGKPDIVTLSTGVLTVGTAPSPLPAQIYRGAFMTKDGFFVQLYQDSVPNMYALVSDTSGTTAGVPVMNGGSPAAGIGSNSAGYVLSPIGSNSFYVVTYGTAMGQFTF